MGAESPVGEPRKAEYLGQAGGSRARGAELGFEGLGVREPLTYAVFCFATRFGNFSNGSFSAAAAAKSVLGWMDTSDGESRRILQYF